MHVELVLPALHAGQAGARAPALELLLARGRTTEGEKNTLEGWLAGAFGLDAPLPAGALTMLAGGGDPGAATWLRADPVHLQLQRDSLALAPGDILPLSTEEAAALAARINRHFAGEFELHVAQPRRWCLRAAGGASIVAAPPLELAGKDVNANLPTGADAARWHAILNEVQMLLHEDPLNESREIPVNSLWFWGAGALPGKVAARWQSATAEDPVVLGLARLSGTRHVTPPPSANEWLERMPEDGRHLILLDGLRAARALGDLQAHAARLQAIETGWCAPLLAGLRSGRVGMVSVLVPDAGRATETTRGDLRRFWRRAKAVA
jgi:hypothetical protein